MEQHKLRFLSFCVAALWTLGAAQVHLNVQNSTVSITATPPVYIPSPTNNLTLTCTWTPPATGTSQLDSLISMLISRRTVNAGVTTYEEVLSVNGFSGFKTINMSPNEAYDGAVRDVTHDSYLSLIIKDATADQITDYLCEVTILTYFGHAESVFANVTVVEGIRNCTVDDLLDLEAQLQNVTQDHACVSSILKTVRHLFLDRYFSSSGSYLGTTYYLYAQPFADARVAQGICEGMGGYLAEIDDLPEYNFIGTFVSAFQSPGDPNALKSIYIGATDEGSEGNYYFRYSGNPMVFQQWGPQEPNGGSGENCVVLWGQGQLGDNPCTPQVTAGFLCEMPPNGISYYTSQTCSLP